MNFSLPHGFCQIEFNGLARVFRTHNLRFPDPVGKSIGTWLGCFDFVGAMLCSSVVHEDPAFRFASCGLHCFIATGSKGVVP